jgi:drug/metabolite transporter (DMT)-like permease
MSTHAQIAYPKAAIAATVSDRPAFSRTRQDYAGVTQLVLGTSTVMQAPDPLHRRGVAAVWLATFIWAWGPVLVKWSSLPGPTFAMCRLWVGVVISFAAIVVTRRRFSYEALRTCALGGLLFAADLGLGFTAVKRTTIADVALISALAPVAIMLVSAYRLHEHVSLRSWVLVAVSFVGVVVVALASAGRPSWSLGGDLLAAASIATWSSYWFFSRRVRDRIDPIIYFACVQLVAALAMTPFAIAVDGVTGIASRDVLSFATVALLPGFVGHTLVIWSHRHVASWLSALITQVSPVITALLAWVVLAERIAPLAAVGGALTVGATMAVITLQAREERFDTTAERVG